MKHPKSIQKSHSPLFFRRSAKVFSAIFVVSLFLLSSVACSFIGGTSGDNNPSISDADYEAEITALHNTISLLNSEIDALKTLMNSETERFEAVIAEIEKELDLLKEPVASEPSNEYFGFTYKEETGEITILSYSGSSTDLILPASIKGKPVTAIADGAFEGSAIRSVSIPDTVSSIGWFAFRNCTSLKKAIISKNVASIGYEAFSGCGALVIYTSVDSYVYRYAESYGISVVAE